MRHILSLAIIIFPLVYCFVAMGFPYDGTFLDVASSMKTSGLDSLIICLARISVTCRNCNNSKTCMTAHKRSMLPASPTGPAPPPIRSDRQIEAYSLALFVISPQLLFQNCDSTHQLRRSAWLNAMYARIVGLRIRRVKTLNLVCRTLDKLSW